MLTTTERVPLLVRDRRSRILHLKNSGAQDGPLRGVSKIQNFTFQRPSLESAEQE